MSSRCCKAQSAPFLVPVGCPSVTPAMHTSHACRQHSGPQGSTALVGGAWAPETAQLQTAQLINVNIDLHETL